MMPVLPLIVGEGLSETLREPPLRVGTLPAWSWVERTFPLTTWYVRIGVSCSAVRSAISEIPSVAKRASKASFVEEKTVKLPVPLSRLTRSALARASTRS